MTQRQIVALAFATLVILGGLGFYFTPVVREVNVYFFLKGYYPLTWQVILGIFTGFVIAFVGWQIVLLPFLDPVKDFFTKVIGNIGLNYGQIIFISICAGIGEEFLFRGAVQPLLGIILTSVLFVFIHGYLNPFNKRLFIYGVFMTLSVSILGYLTEKIGIVCSMTAHAVIDIYLLSKLTFHN